MPIFLDRHDAGKQLANALIEYKNQKNTLVLALPRGGVPVGYDISHALNLPFDIFLVRKLGTPGQEELAMGAIAIGDIKLMNDEVIKGLNITKQQINDAIDKEKLELERRNTLYRHNKPFPNLKGKTIILVDDGIATGATVRVAVIAIKKLEAKTIIIATPVAPYETVDLLKKEVDKVYCLATPEPFYAIGIYYNYFPQLTDLEVKSILEKSA